VTARAAAPGPGQPHRRLTEAIGYADGVLNAVTPQLLPGPTPCRAWNLRMLLEHVEESLTALQEGVTAGRVAASPPGTRALVSGASPAAALVGAFRQRATALLDASVQAGDAAPVTIGGLPLPLDCLLTVGALEIAVHAWDVSQACGQCLPIPDEPAADLLAQALVLVPRLGRHPLFAAPAPVPARGTSSDLLTAYLGRPAVQPGETGERLESPEATSSPQPAELAFSPGRSRSPENLAWGCGLSAGWGRCRSVARWALLGCCGPVGERGWEDRCGLPLTPSARGITSPEFCLARGPDLSPRGYAVDAWRYDP